MRKVTSLARDYATRRQAFGKRLADHPLHIQTLARMEVETRGCQVLLLVVYSYDTIHSYEGLGIMFEQYDHRHEW